MTEEALLTLHLLELSTLVDVEERLEKNELQASYTMCYNGAYD